MHFAPCGDFFLAQKIVKVRGEKRKNLFSENHTFFLNHCETPVLVVKKSKKIKKKNVKKSFHEKG